MDTTTRQRRHARLRSRLHGTAARPRVSVHRSSRHLHVQLIDDEAGRTLIAASSKDVKADAKTAQATAVGEAVAAAAKKAGIKQVVFDRSGYRYHGRVKAIAEGLRTGGLTL